MRVSSSSGTLSESDPPWSPTRSIRSIRSTFSPGARLEGADAPLMEMNSACDKRDRRTAKKLVA